MRLKKAWEIFCLNHRFRAFEDVLMQLDMYCSIRTCSTLAHQVSRNTFGMSLQWRGGSTLAGGHNQFWHPLENWDCSTMCHCYSKVVHSNYDLKLNSFASFMIQLERKGKSLGWA